MSERESQHGREDARCPNCGNKSILELHCEHCGYGLDGLEDRQRDRGDEQTGDRLELCVVWFLTLLVAGIGLSVYGVLGGLLGFVPFGMYVVMQVRNGGESDD